MRWMQSFAPLGSPSIPADWVSTADQQLPDVTTLYVTPESLSSVVVTVGRDQLRRHGGQCRSGATNAAALRRSQQRSAVTLAIEFGDPVSHDRRMSTWRTYRRLWHELRVKRPSLWLLEYGLCSGVVFAVVGLMTSTHWTNVLFIWACCNVGAIAFQWWRGGPRPRGERA
jgi:hypothetical protein